MFTNEIVKVPFKYKMMRGLIIFAIASIVESIVEHYLDKKFLSK